MRQSIRQASKSMLVNYKFILTIPGSVYHRATLQRTNTGGLVISNPGTLDRHYSLPADHNSFNRTGASLPLEVEYFILQTVTNAKLQRP